MHSVNLNKIELEITSDCNAACPGCARTQFEGLYEINYISIDDIKQMFPTRDTINDKEFKFCGVLGDPALNTDCLEMVDYISSHGGYCELSTNGGIQRAEWWQNLGQIAAKRPGLVHVHFCVDGYEETNYIYRINTVYKVVDRNMQAFSNSAPPKHGTWVYIVFDHNEHELHLAEKRAEELNFKFATRTGMRNSFNDWVAQLRKKKKKNEQ
jgi:MoaA/NifB/PqqE/SkfB family radical SAM enzyme